MAENGRAQGPYTAVYTSRYGPYTAVYTTRYTTVYGRVDGPYTAVYTALVHVGTWIRVRGRTRVVYMAVAVYTFRVRGRVRPMYTAEDVHTDGSYMYTGGVDGPCARPIHVRVRAVYTARPLYGRVRAVFAGEDVFTGRLHGRRVTGTRHVTRPCTRPCTHRHGRVHGVYTARTRPHITTAVYTDV